MVVFLGTFKHVATIIVTARHLSQLIDKCLAFTVESLPELSAHESVFEGVFYYGNSAQKPD